jgi:hypothetical protein
MADPRAMGLPLGWILRPCCAILYLPIFFGCLHFMQTSEFPVFNISKIFFRSETTGTLFDHDSCSESSTNYVDDHARVHATNSRGRPKSHIRCSAISTTTFRPSLPTKRSIFCVRTSTHCPVSTLGPALMTFCIDVLSHSLYK